MSFAVVRVDQYYDYVEGVECIDVFQTEQEANNLIQEMKDKRDTSWKDYDKYIETFVDNIDPPKTDYQGWEEYIKQFFGNDCRYVLPKDFKKELKRYLRDYSPKLEGYNPPSIILGWTNLFVVEIKSKSS